MLTKKTYIFIQARISSSRLKEKMLKKIGNNEIFRLVLKRAKLSNLPIVALFPNEKDIYKLIKIAMDENIEYFVWDGSTNDVFSRFYFAYKKYKPEYIIRVTADNPLFDIENLKLLAKIAEIKNPDFIISLSNIVGGLNLLFKANLLDKWKKLAATSPLIKEHVTWLITSGQIADLKGILLDYSNFYKNRVRLTVDFYEDYKLISYLNLFFNLENIDLKSIYDFLQINQHIAKINSDKIHEVEKTPWKTFLKEKQYSLQAVPAPLVLR